MINIFIKSHLIKNYYIDSCKDANAKTPLCNSCLDTYYMNVDTCTSCANDKC